MTHFGELKTKRHARGLGRDYKKRDPPLKACFHCAEVQPTGTRVCPSCGTEHYPKRNNPSPFKGIPNEERRPYKDGRYKA